MPPRRFSGPLLPGTTSVRQVNRRNTYAKKNKARTTVTWLPTQSKSNPAVAKAYKKPPIPKTKTGMNKQAIYTLSKQVRNLQNQRLGELQKNIQFCNLQGGTLPTHDAPVAFLVNDLYEASHCMKGVLTNQVPGFAENAVFTNVTSPTDIQAQYSWVNRENDIVSKNVYKPVFSRINFVMKCMWPGLTPEEGHVRITILRVKPFLASNKIDVALPQTLGAYRYLANKSPNRGYFNSDYHKVLYDKWIKFTPSKITDSNADRTIVHKTVSIPWKFGQSEVCRPDFTGDHAERFWTNMPEGQQTWCLISVGQNLNNMLQTIQIGRVNMWRDQHGTT
jgi:hypothetical protein